MNRNNVRIAIQKSGRLRPQSIKLLKSWGVDIEEKNDGVLVVPCNNGAIEVLFVRYGDIPLYVQNGAADFGIIGKNLLHEEEASVNIVKSLGFGKCSLVIAVPKNSKLEEVADLEGERIATSYPNSLRKFLKEQNCSAAIVNIKGGVEATPKIGLADAICDITQTGETLKANGLRIIAKFFESEAVLIESPFSSEKAREFKQKTEGIK